MYRLAGPDDLHEVGWQEAVARARWVFVEWPERIGAAVPAERLDVAITIDSPTARTFTFTGHGSAHAAALPCLTIRSLASKSWIGS
jgi:tRNA A37 threonylcarbamoyladenosine biosynthesis protein TsaE